MCFICAFDQSDSHFISYSENCNRKQTSAAAVRVLTSVVSQDKCNNEMYSKFHIKTLRTFFKYC